MISDTMKYGLVEVFESIQGEGYNFGMPAVFIRLAHCNFNCSWCDTDWKKVKLELTYKELKEQYLNKAKTNNVIITGGEPTLFYHVFENLIQNLQRDKFKVYVETNGYRSIKTIKSDKDYININYKRLWVSISPKICYWPLYKKQFGDHIIEWFRANEIRIVIDPDIEEKTQIQIIKEMVKYSNADHYYLSPCEKNGKFELKKLSVIYYELNKWLDKTIKDEDYENVLTSNGCLHNRFKISLQLHKLMGVE